MANNRRKKNKAKQNNLEKMFEENKEKNKENLLLSIFIELCKFMDKEYKLEQRILREKGERSGTTIKNIIEKNANKKSVDEVLDEWEKFEPLVKMKDNNAKLKVELARIYLDITEGYDEKNLDSLYTKLKKRAHCKRDTYEKIDQYFKAAFIRGIENNEDKMLRGFKSTRGIRAKKKAEALKIAEEAEAARKKKQQKEASHLPQKTYANALRGITGGQKKSDWNKFLKKHKGKGYSMKKLSKMYKKKKSKK